MARGGRTGLFDDIVGTGFTLLCTEDPQLLLDPADLAFLDALGTRPVRVLPAGTAPEKAGEHDVVDIDDVYLPYLAEAAAGTATGMLVRPDFYLFGTTRDRDDLAALVEDLRGRLEHTQP